MSKKSKKVSRKKFTGATNALLDGIIGSLENKVFDDIELKFIGVCICKTPEGLLINVGGNVDRDEAPSFLRKTAEKIEEIEGDSPSIEDLMGALKEVLSDEIDKLQKKEDVT